jgi:non-specific serine/threonine protein kinase
MLGMDGLMAWSVGNLGHAAYFQGQLASARARYLHSLRLAQQVGDKRVIAERLEELAWVACKEAQVESAARLFGAAEALREVIGAPMPPANRTEYDRCVAVARGLLGESALRASWTAGRALSLEQAITEAATLDKPHTAGQTTALLTPRERHVALLVAQGKSNREIADSLYISESTVRSHLHNILSKLNLANRVQAAAFVHSQRSRSRATTAA